MTTIDYATHTAHLDALNGTGILVPKVVPDVRLAGGDTLAATGWDEAVTDLIRRGWQPQTDDECPVGTLAVLATLPDGRRVTPLWAEPIGYVVDIERIAEAFTELLVRRCPEGFALMP